jgi:hypothetical protein
MSRNCTENWATFKKISRRQMRFGSRVNGREKVAASAGWLEQPQIEYAAKGGNYRQTWRTEFAQ